MIAAGVAAERRAGEPCVCDVCTDNRRGCQAVNITRLNKNQGQGFGDATKVKTSLRVTLEA